MDRDIRETSVYKEAEELFRSLRQPGTGRISDAIEVNASPDGQHAVFAGTTMDALETTASVAPTRIGQTSLISGETHMLTFGPNTDRLPKYSPDGQHVAFLSDRTKAGDFQLYLLDPVSCGVRAAPKVDGWVEYLHWSPDGQRVLLGVAGHGADVAGGQGAITSKQASDELPSWMPFTETRDEEFRWRRIWIYELATDRAWAISKAKSNIWEATWCGNESFAAVVSPGPGEGLWYSAHLQIIDVKTGDAREIHVPKEQLGWAAASPSGKRLAVVDAVCSDRWIVAGDLRLIDTTSGKVQQVSTNGIDVTYTEWRSDHKLLLAGHRGFETAVGLLDTDSGVFRETWASHEISGPGFYIHVSGFGDAGDCVLSGRGFRRAPEIGVIRSGEYRTARSFDVGYGRAATVLSAVETVTWKAGDGLDIQGWLLRPKEARAPCPLVLTVHGGPIGHWRPFWLMPLQLMMLRRGWAIFLTNPRGSSGRGPDFARRVIGDMGGDETHDHLSGIDYLVKCGVADPKRLGVIGASHGGFMSSWLITQDARFAAAVPVAPVTNFVSEHLIGNIPHFVTLFLNDKFNNPEGRYFSRSPIMYAHKVRTPTLNICGALDRCTPPSESFQFHNALLENGVKSVLLTYPEEGHGIRKLPAVIDYTARIIGWFGEHFGD